MLEWVGGSIHLWTSCIDVSDLQKGDELLLNPLCVQELVLDQPLGAT